ncbi:MAG: DUF305 domain-containing protein [Balneola sp.]|nr:DUF305 domain-containing protein [Balneola sp.]MBO6649392.1 DUF305 domain-containing protein [Balneola sp.]MBO6711207.1 DUF305 domain-containing protein [Balneola sp.]MBO6800678.1 DUF305 domain-containing protein [Balneola sp.]MBO6869143.1 DUF305 domain-containing protein [Balneola sp.]
MPTAKKILLISTLVFSTLILSVCSSSKNASSPNSETVSQQKAEQPSKAELEEIYWARIDSSKMNFTEADVKFMTGMIGHHAQALIMSRLAPENNASSQVQTLAARIINAQKDEIATMQTWLRDRGQSVPEVHIDGLKLMIHGTGMDHSNHMNMAGMLSQEQLVELSNAKGKKFDELYLKYMIQHHQGAVTMVQTLINTDGAAQDEQAFRLSTDINVDQITEIERMKRMLSEIQSESQ